MTKKLFWLGILGIFIISLALRFWGLDRFNTLVFDEVYYAKFGHNYLTHVPFFDGHPPLGKLIIAGGIWLSDRVKDWSDAYNLSFYPDLVNGLSGAVRSPWGYRWVNALFGSFIPVLVAGIAYQLSYSYGFSLLAGFFTACDGIFIVESRYALINIYIVIFGLLGQFLLLLALGSQQKQRQIYLILAGVAFGASLATKWNGLWFLLGTYSLWVIAWLQRILSQQSEKNGENYPLSKFSRINIFQLALYLGIIPLIIYSLIWIPHLQLDKRYDFIEVHKQILGFHERLGGNSSKIHPYCADWYKWILMIRPMAYYYQTTQKITDPLPVTGPTLPSGYGKVIYDVHAMGNPFLWWFGIAILLFLCGMLIWQSTNYILQRKTIRLPAQFTRDTWIALYLVINYAANLLPWVKVSRCLFIYHYMTALPFVFMAIAWFVEQCLRSYYKYLRILGVTVTFIIIAGLIFWLPIYLGLPLLSQDYQLRMWFKSWI
ncbi:dolichyl-phosphate-mannose--protein mannosyltransferase [Calothrix sp. 336/3]|uniref:dolichyl-phosphate-mannose--protein mannosyltransferase n=1 Tax=Calothrix sp. 336/3 TaxID=1337936 RepID=UPI0004E41206|nr:phospholipid carrier-dependent glycosyltransferase [Calothrix sp. 336/3]AKG20051.1 dolichyl-phosphate-mannose--protein O-mannosyl transferase [Calothrix sp. 336/3]